MPQAGGLDARAEEQARIRMLAHELRTPLAAIAALAEVMRDERLGPVGQAQYLGYAGDIFAGARHALDVLDSVVAGTGDDGTARTDGTSGCLDMTNVDIAGLAQRVTHAAVPLAESFGVTLTWQTSERLPLLVGNARCLQQILYNLVFNALRSTPPGRSVVVATFIGPDGQLELSVADTGDGFQPEVLADIRRRVEATGEGVRPRAGRLRSGSGLGLPLVSALARANGGTLSIESSAGLGALVAVRFPQGRLIHV